MRKRKFLKTSSALAVSTAINPWWSCGPVEKKKKETVPKRTNWAGNLTYSAANLYEPSDIKELREAVINCDKLRVLGSKHCFNKIADSKTNQVSTQGFSKILELNEETLQVTVEGGVTYGELCPELHRRGYALHNLASLPHISIAGACATATHGSGKENGNLATAVSALELMTADGELVKLSKKDSDTFHGAVVAFGALGVVTKLTLNIEPTYQVRQDCYLDLPENALLENFDTIMSSGYSVSLFADYATDKINQVWMKRKVGDDPVEGESEFFGARLADRNIHPILELSAENCTEQMGVPGPWYDRLPHFKIGFTPSSGTELQAEYFVPAKHAVEAYQAIRRLNDQISPLLMISEIRAVAADDLWMSTAYREPQMVFHFTCEQDWAGLKKVLPQIEKELNPFDVRPHWGKMFTMNAGTLDQRYQKMNDFRSLLKEFDPRGKFRNEFVDKYLFG